MLEKEFKYYLDNQDELVQKYNNRVLVIINNKVVADYDDYKEAYINSEKEYKLGTFLLQKCTAGNKDYSITFHSGLRFN